MMTKKDFKQLANMLACISDENERDKIVNMACEFCFRNNCRFDSDRFREWIRRIVAGESLKGLG